MKSRIQSVDALRGLIMIVMALDHVRDFFHSAASQFQPDDLTRTTTALFFTRWITHFCAPVFFFTAGIGAFFWLRGDRTRAQLSAFLWKRGLWLVLLELTVLRLAMNFSVLEGPLLLSILWALGWSMVALGFLVHVPVRALAILSVAGIALHNLADKIPAARFGNWAWLWNVLHQQGAFTAGSITVVAAYPLVPWMFVMSAGFCFGRIIAMDAIERRRWLLRIGAALTVAFLLIRAINIYGDPRPWTNGILSFLRVTKYPPSLDFLLMTIGPAILLLACFNRVTFSRANPLVVFGRVPLFYFLGHLFLAHALMIPFALVRHGRAGFLFGPLRGDQYPADYGYDLWVVYAVWIAVVVMLYPLCLWFARVKERRHDWWLSYL
ncbi:MAG TPA: heparan-alpha-glucosaminide N-acetyltransferase domain-containing protein [Bryobacteraceae bacterium]|nr:heparan-alpha-glucosaminide N-acetyltransferase domain-containing protein [Bryobacteraceae bacterium]